MTSNVEEEQVLKISHEDRYGTGRGHYQYECPDWEQKANYAEFEEKEEEEILLMSYVEIKHEDVCWNCDNNKDVLEWKNDYENDIQERGKNANEEGNNNRNEEGGNIDDTTNSIESNSSSSESHEAESNSPSYLADYETGEGLSDEDNLNAMMMFTEDDPLSFEEARKSIESHLHKRLPKSMQLDLDATLAEFRIKFPRQIGFQFWNDESSWLGIHFAYEELCWDVLFMCAFHSHISFPLQTFNLR
ncbi:hypothetical protein KIW84_058062 [Lathyrus oleraceus]|uniref:Uncharacterized protein n=1 Tax=Pisum sativum TaxID=3888 RepID=A0A9D4X7S3_PEA|nr:hypothetical protein KIW84_058062 [Pisum sativum]